MVPLRQGAPKGTHHTRWVSRRGEAKETAGEEAADLLWRGEAGGGGGVRLVDVEVVVEDVEDLLDVGDVTRLQLGPDGNVCAGHRRQQRRGQRDIQRHARKQQPGAPLCSEHS